MIEKALYLRTITTRATIMRRLALLLPFLLILTDLSAQTLIQGGVVYRYNGKAPRTPVENATLTCMNAVNQSVRSASDGSFQFEFSRESMGGRTPQMGDRILCGKISKREMIVFNQDAVDEWSIRKDPLCLVLRDKADFENQKKELIAIGMREAEKKYEAEKIRLESLYNEKKIALEEKEEALDKAWGELERFQGLVDKYADLFARIDEREVDEQAQQAVELFNQGKVDEAIKLFEEGHYLEKLQEDNRVIRQAEELIKDAGKTISLTEDARKKHILALESQAAAYQLQNRWEDAGRILKGLADELGDYNHMMGYASFAFRQNQFNEAEGYFLTVINNCKSEKDPDNELNTRKLAGALNNLGNVYVKTKQSDKCEKMYLDAIELRRRLVKLGGTAYESDLIASLNNLAGLYQIELRLKESERVSLEAIEIHRRRAVIDTYEYDAEYALSLYNLGTLYFYMRRMEDSENYLKEAIDSYRHLAQVSPVEYEPSLAAALNALGSVYNRENKLEDSEKTLLESIDISRHLVDSNSKAHEPSLASSINNLAIVYSKMRRYEDSEKLFQEVVEIDRRLAEANPKAYQANLAKALHNLASNYRSSKKMEDSEQAYLEAIQIRRTLAARSPELFEQDLISSLLNLHKLYEVQHRDEDAAALLPEIVDILRRISVKNPRLFNRYLGSFLRKQSDYYAATGCTEEAEQLFREAVEIFRFEADNDSEAKVPFLLSLYDLGVFYFDNGMYVKSSECLTEAIAGCRKVIEVAPDENMSVLAAMLDALSRSYIFMSEPKLAETCSREAVALAPDKTRYEVNLAGALLLQGKYEKAKQIVERLSMDCRETLKDELFKLVREEAVPKRRVKDVRRMQELLSE